VTLTRTGRINSQSATSFGTGDFTTGSFTPSDSSLLVVIACCEPNGLSSDPSGDMTITDSAGLTWTSRCTAGDAAWWSFGMRAWTAPVATGASMTVTIGAAGVDAYVYQVDAVDYTGYAGVGTTGSNNSLPINGAGSVTLDAAPAVTSEIIGGIFQQPEVTGGATPASGHTEIYDDFISGATGFQVQVRPAGSTSTSFAWDDVDTGGQLYKGIGLALEITEASATPAIRRPAAAPVWRRSLNLT